MNTRGGLIPLLCLVLSCLVIQACSSDSDDSSSRSPYTVNSLEDTATPPTGTVTLRSALAAVPSGGTITFSRSLDGDTIVLTTVGESHSVLMGEVYSGMTFAGYQERDYGKSALYARKDVTIDATALSRGITLAWGGGEDEHARVLAVYGNLTMRNVAITSGYAYAEALESETQPYTLGRGGGLAVWGTANLDHCTLIGNTAEGDLNSSRDRGTYGGGIYADSVTMTDCVVSGNRAEGYGAAGGGIYSVGGADTSGLNSSLTRCTVSGNRTTAQHSYGGGIFSLGGGPNNTMTMRLTNCTVARNLVEDNPALDQIGQYYYRGGGVYLGGGYLTVKGCTIAQNSLTGTLTSFSNKPNMNGGGIAATIGNAHVVENMKVWHSIIVGNTLNGDANDLFTGSLLHFYTFGYNLVGVLDFSQILVPVPAWEDLCRKHWPKAGDQEGVSAADVLDLDGAVCSDDIASLGADEGDPAVLWYPPAGDALDKVPAQIYTVTAMLAGYTGYGTPPDEFINLILEKLRTDYSETLGEDFGTGFGDMSAVTWYESAATWVSDPQNAAWIAFWRDLDTEIAGRLDAAGLNDEFWGSFTSGSLGDGITISVGSERYTVTPLADDQRGNPRAAGTPRDIGAIEQ